MPFTLTMPKMSPTMEEGAIAKWHKKEGDQVEAGELIIEVSTDKATVEFNAIDGGWLRKILVQEGQEAMVNQPIAILTEDKEESIEGYQPEGAAAKEEKPVEQEAIDKEGSEKKPQEAPKASQKREGMSQPSFVPEPALETAFAFPTQSIGQRVLASPLAKKIAKDKGLDVSSVKGTGPGGRIMSRDLSLAQPSAASGFTHRKLPELAPGTFEEESLSQMRKSIAQRLQDAKTFIPHFYVSLQVDASPLVATRDQLRNGDVKVTYNDFVIRAAALALKEHPDVNSGFNTVNNTIIRFKTIDVSVAVSLPTGLITPIIRHADFKNLGELSIEMRYLAKKAKDGKLEPQEYKGGSFTISNLGMYGVSDFVAIINPPQAAILAVSGILEQPVVKKGQIVAGHIMTLTLSADHRVIDGAAGASFLKTVQKYLENPALLLI